MTPLDAERALDLVVEKAARLERLSFTQYLLQKEPLGFRLSFQEEGATYTRTGPNDEAVDAFLLTFRFFVQDNEATSIRRIEEALLTLPLPPAHHHAASETRKRLNEFLKQNIDVGVANVSMTKGELLHTFLYGDRAHANSRKKALVDQWRSEPTFPILEMQFVSVLASVLSFILWFAMASRHALAIVRGSTSSDT